MLARVGVSVCTLAWGSAHACINMKLREDACAQTCVCILHTCVIRLVQSSGSHAVSWTKMGTVWVAGLRHFELNRSTLDKDGS